MHSFTGDELIDARRSLDVPFKLCAHSNADAREFVCEKILRLLPGKRLVALANDRGSQVVIKTFLGKTAHRYLSKEKRGVRAISDAGVLTPELLWEGELARGGGKILAFEYLKDAPSLQEMWEQARSDHDRIDILSRAMIVMALLHNRGVVQHDLHLANFLLHSGELYTIDGGGIGTNGSQSPLGEASSLKNLAKLFAHFLSRYDELIATLFPAYEEIRGWPHQPAREKRLRLEVNRRRLTRKRHYIDKTLRDCTRFVCRSEFNNFHVCERAAYSSEMKRLLSYPDEFIRDGKILKHGNTATVAAVEVPGRHLVIKRYNIKSPWHAIKRSVQASRARLSWLNAHKLEFLGIPALKPIAMIENRFGPLSASAYFISEFIDGPDAAQWLTENDETNVELKQITEILYLLSEARISHGDLKSTNFLMSKSGPVIIDLDAMKEHRNVRTFNRAFNKDLQRFLANWKDKPKIQSEFGSLLGDLTNRYGRAG